MIGFLRYHYSILNYLLKLQRLALIEVQSSVSQLKCLREPWFNATNNHFNSTFLINKIIFNLDFKVVNAYVNEMYTGCFFLFWLIWHVHNSVIFWAKIEFLDIFHIYVPVIFCKKNFRAVVRLLIFLCCF